LWKYRLLFSLSLYCTVSKYAVGQISLRWFKMSFPSPTPQSWIFLLAVSFPVAHINGSEVCKNYGTAVTCSSRPALCPPPPHKQADTPCWMYQHAPSRNIFSFRYPKKERRQSLGKSSLEVHCVSLKQAKEYNES